MTTKTAWLLVEFSKGTMMYDPFCNNGWCNDDPMLAAAFFKAKKTCKNCRA